MVGDKQYTPLHKKLLLVGHNPDHILLVKAAFAQADPSAEIEAVMRAPQALWEMQHERRE